MDEIGIKLDILHEALDQKTKILEQLINITDNQEMFFKTLKGADLNSYMTEAINEKQKLIDKLNDIDTAFIATFKSFKGELNEKKQNYREKIISMQEKIKILFSLDMSVRAKEEHLKRFIAAAEMIDPSALQKASTPKIKGLKASKKYMLKQYENFGNPKKKT